MSDIKFKYDGREYTYNGGFGAQIHSIEFEPVPKGTMRWIFDRPFYIFSCNKKGWINPVWNCDWALAVRDRSFYKDGKYISPISEAVDQLKEDLRSKV